MENRPNEMEEWHEDLWDGQGRTPQEVEDSEIAGVYLFGGFLVTLVLFLVAGTCYGMWSAVQAVYETIQSYNE